MKFLSEIERNLRVSIFVSFITVLALLCSIYCIVIGFYEVPLGFALGGLLISLLYLLAHFMYRLDEKNGTAKYSIIMIALRNTIIIGVIILLAFLYYEWEIRLFNIFAVVGIYQAGIIIQVIDYLLFK